jgi:multidrug efflux pump subunit AcrA (membrane-fusion protein)
LSRGRALLARRLTGRGLTLTAGALAILLSQHGASAGVPPSLASATLRAARAFAAGQTVASLVSSSVVSLSRGVLKAMLWTKLTKVMAALLLACLSVAVWAQFPGAAGQTEPVLTAELPAIQAGGPAGKVKGQPQAFDQLSPAARFQIVNKINDPEKEFQAADRGDVTMSISARGSLASANPGDIYCQVRANPQFGQPSKGKPFATIIKWIVDDGSHVHKGDVLVRLDDSYWQALLEDNQGTQAAIAAAEAALEQAKLHADFLDLDGEIAVRAAELKAKKYLGNDPDEKEIQKLELKKAQVSWQLAKIEGQSKLKLAKAELQAKKASAEQVLAHLDDIKDQIKKCTIRAPKDGVVNYYTPEGTKNPAPLLAPGEKVREGQKLLQMPDLDNMLATIKVPENLVASLHGEGKDKSKWQPALIKVDAYPNTVLKGHVKFVDTVAAQPDFFAENKKVYKTLVAIDKDQNAKLPHLLPAMSAEVTIPDVARKNDVVRVPVQAVVQVGPGHFCYVKVGKEILKREVTLGLVGHQYVEIKSGIQADDIVVRDVDGLVKRLSPLLGPGKK